MIRRDYPADPVQRAEAERFARILAELVPAPTSPGAALRAARRAPGIPWARAAEGARRLGVEIAPARLRNLARQSGPANAALLARIREAVEKDR